MKIFKNSSKDAWLVLYTVALAIAPFAIILANLDFIWWIVMLPFHAWLICNLHNSPLHHHSHWSTFTNKKANALYELLLSMVGGIAHQSWKWSHLTHHVYVNDRPEPGATTKDPVSVFKYGKNGEVENFWSFCIRGSVENIAGKIRRNQKTTALYNHTQNNIESWSWIVYSAIIIAVDVKFGAWMLVVYALANFLNMATSYGEHWGVLDRRGDTTQDSIGIYSKWYNWIGFGAGYHQEHHNKPGVHWTKLHTLTPKMHPNRRTVKSMHIFNNPYWSHFKLLFKR
jgi:fatty acid desaturase